MEQRELITPGGEQARLEIAKTRGFVRLLLTSMRPYQWVKNLFILIPLLFGKKLGDPAAVGQALCAFSAFCLMSSALYIFNDVVDAAEDRAHPQKRLRPIASGDLPIAWGLGGAGALLLAALWLAVVTMPGSNFLFVALIYFFLTLAYCVALKKMMILDCMAIASGFVLRVVSGAAAVGVAPTHWLMVCAFLLALFLAFSKRRQELIKLSYAATEHRQVLGEYSVGFLDQVNNLLIGAAIVCYALYTVAPETVERFRTDSLIYGTAFVVYGLLRYLALLRDPAKGGNPTRMLLTDRPLQMSVFGWAIFNALVIYHEQIGMLAARVRF